MKKVFILMFASFVAFYAGQASACPQSNTTRHSKTKAAKNQSKQSVQDAFRGSYGSGVSK